MNVKRYLNFIVMASVSIILSCTEKNLPSNPISQDTDEIIPPEVSLIADKIYADREFAFVERIYLRRLKSALALNDQEAAEKVKSVEKFPIGKNLNQTDANILAKSLNFKDAAEFTDYLSKFGKILEKYSFANLPAASANQVMKLLTRKCLSKSFSNDNEVITMINMRTSDKNSKTQTGWGSRPECWKCAFDYIDCQQGYQSGWYSVTVTMTFTKTTFNDSYSVTWSGGNYTVTMSYDYSWSTYTMNGSTQSYGSTSGCHQFYSNCLALCNT